jgi:hypothetical protein
MRRRQLQAKQRLRLIFNHLAQPVLGNRSAQNDGPDNYRPYAL